MKEAALRLLAANGQQTADAKPPRNPLPVWQLGRVIGSLHRRDSPIVRGTRILADTIVQNYELGESVEEIREGFPSLSVDQIQRLIEFAQARIEQPHREGRDRRRP